MAKKDSHYYPTSSREGSETANLGIDLGTAYTLVFKRKKGIVLNEPSVVAVDLISGEIIAVGQEAKKMLGKTPEKISVIRPMRNGVIADFDTTREMLKYFMLKTGSLGSVKRPKVIISIPYGTTTVEKRAVMEAAQQAGAREALLMEEPLAAAIGAGLPVEEPVGNMVVNIGGGTTEIAVISLGGIVNGRSLRMGGDAIDDAIRSYLRKYYRLEVGAGTAEKLKIELGTALENSDSRTHKVPGIDLRSGLPVSVEISAGELSLVIQEPLKEITSAIRDVFEKTSPQLASDIIKNGIVLTGGGAKLKNLDKFIKKDINLPIHVAKKPQECVALGTGAAITHLNVLTRMALFQL